MNCNNWNRGLSLNLHYNISKEQLKMDNSEKLANLDRLEEDKQNKKTQHNICWTPLCATNANNINKT
jgi:hypothetical protein